MATAPYPCFWLKDNAREAADYYCSIFPDSRIINANPMAVVFDLNGARHMALNGAGDHGFNEGISLVITCDNQEEIDHYWDCLSENGQPGRCGWLKDKFGVSWQVVPRILGELMSNPETAPKTMYAFMQMSKFDIAKLLEAQA